MPEIKNTFSQAKMNKDLDERLVPNGQYRNAVNVQVSTSEGSNVGAIENVLGNLLISDISLVDPGARCVGAISDEGKDNLYYFVASPPSGEILYNVDGEEKSGILGWDFARGTGSNSSVPAIQHAPDNYVWQDKIFQHSGKQTPVFVDNYLVKTSFNDSVNLSNGTNVNTLGSSVFGETSNKYYYTLNATENIHVGMTCYFFNDDNHDNVVSGLTNVSDFSGGINALDAFGVPYLLGTSSAVTRKVVDVDLDINGNVVVIFDKPLIFEHLGTNFPDDNNTPPIDSSKAGYNYLIFSKPRVLNFNCNNLITGINILYDFLLWTDNDSEPKKIHVPRSIEGTSADGLQHTRLIVDERRIGMAENILVKEDNISVIKKSPKQKPLIEEKIEYALKARTKIGYNFVQEDATGSNIVIAEAGSVIVVTFDSFDGGNNFILGEELRFLEDGSIGSLPNDFKVRCKVVENISNVTQSQGPSVLGTPSFTFTYPPNTYKLEILSISANTPTDLTTGLYTDNQNLTNIMFNVERILDTQSLFEKTFPRFGYRWRYQDGEYSTFSPFSDIVFEPGQFNYNAQNAFNTAMENHLIRLTLRNIISQDIPSDVIQVDILYVESNSSTVYVVDKLRYNDYEHVAIGTSMYNHWQANQYEIKSDIIYAAVPANQLLRPWDNVPRKALAQEVTGNRVVYANYLQNYNLKRLSDGLYEKPVLEVSLDDRWNTGILNGGNFGNKILFNDLYLDEQALANPELNFPFMIEKEIVNLTGAPSLKSDRKYQLGFTYLDEYGRETPVFSNSEATVDVTKKHADDYTLLSSKIVSTPPTWAKTFKAYVKETSNEYYNVAMDRIYKGEDGNLWLSFPSAERNKIQEDTFLILKKGVDSDSLVVEKARYKVVAISNEAPNFLKTKSRFIGKALGNSGSTSGIPIDYLFESFSGGTLSSVLGPGVKSFKINSEAWKEESGVILSESADAFDFRVGTQYSRKYNIADITLDEALDEYTITLDKFVNSDEDWMYNVGTSVYDSNLELRFYKQITRQKPEFLGKFFVKINGDGIAEQYLNANADSAVTYAVSGSFNAYYFSDTGKNGIIEGTTKLQIDNTWNYYQSNNVNNPHTGGQTPIGAQSALTTQVPGQESTDGLEDWEEVLDLNQGGGPLSSWFIDEVFYAGIHPTGNSNNVNNPNHVRATNSDYDYGKGIYYDYQLQQFFMELSFSQLEPDSGVAGSHFTGTSNDELNYADFNESWIWAVGSGQNTSHSNQSSVVQNFLPGNKFRFVGDENNVIYTISENINIQKIRRYNHTAFDEVEYRFNQWNNDYIANGSSDPTLETNYSDAWERFASPTNRRITYRIPVDKDILDLTRILNGSGVLEALTDPDRQNSATNITDATVVQFIVQRTDDDAEILASSNPVIFETEPKEAIDLNLFYQASDSYPTELTIETAEQWVPLGSIVSCKSVGVVDSSSVTMVTGWELNAWGGLMVKFSQPLDIIQMGRLTVLEQQNLTLRFTRPDNSFTTLKGFWNTSYTVPGFGFPATININNQTPFVSSTYGTIWNETAYQVHDGNLTNNKIGLSWFNTYSFGNGVESNRLRDGFNQIQLSKGTKVSTTLDEPYEEERRGSGLIYSGIYNSNSGINNLNQFIQAEKITKDINPTYGSIQKLFSRNTDLVTFCEDRVIRIAANKDAIFNADGNPQLIATPNVLGQVLPFTGDYGISKNPESFAKESYRAYFTDAKKGAVLRLSKDGITPISDKGMKDYFIDLFRYNTKPVIGSYDDRKGLYNLTISSAECGDPNLQNDPTSTVSYSENVGGWESFKSFELEQGLSLSGKYYTVKQGMLYEHHSDAVDRNTFYGIFQQTSVVFVFNTSPDVVKSFHTLNYEGSESRVTAEINPFPIAGINSNTNQGYNNLPSNVKDGWFCPWIVTDLQTAKVPEFIEKEGKWFNYPRGIYGQTQGSIPNPSNFNVMGLGIATGLPPATIGCMDPLAYNHNVDTAGLYGPLNGPLVFNTASGPGDPNECLYSGCMDPNSSNYFSTTYNGNTYIATIINPLIPCDYIGCDDPFALNPNETCGGVNLSLLVPPLAITTPDNSCCNYPPSWDCDLVAGGIIQLSNGQGAYVIGTTYATNLDAYQAARNNCPLCGTVGLGCMDVFAVNYDPLATCDDGTCIDYTLGCMDDGAMTTTLTNSYGVTIWPAQSPAGTTLSCVAYDSYVDASGNPVVASNYDASADGMDCSCDYIGCMDCGSIWEASTGQLCDPVNFPNGMTTPGSSNYQPFYTSQVVGSCCVDGCMDSTATNYDAANTCTNGNLIDCIYFVCNDINSTFTFHWEPWDSNPITSIPVPDVVLEQTLCDHNPYGHMSGSGNVNLFDNNSTGHNFPTTSFVSTGDVCAEGFTTVGSALGLSRNGFRLHSMGTFGGHFGGMHSSDGFGDGMINSLDGFEGFVFGHTFFEVFGCYLQNITTIRHSNPLGDSKYLDQNGDNASILQLMTGGVDANGTFLAYTGTGVLQLKSLPLSGDVYLDLEFVGSEGWGGIDIEDCGLEEIRNITEFISPNTGTRPGKCMITIANNWKPSFGGLYASFLSPPHPRVMSPFKRHDGGAFDGATSYVNPLLPSTCTDGTNLMYNGSVDSIGSASEPLLIDSNGYAARSSNPDPYHKGLFEDYEPTAGWAGNEIHNWNTTNDGASTTPRRIWGVVRLINLPKLKHLYIHDSFNTNNYQNAYMKYTNGVAGPENQFDYNEIGAASFTTRGCHADLKIHVGSQGKIDEMEQAYGTGDSNSIYYTQKSNSFFKKYFEGTHRFVV